MDIRVIFTTFTILCFTSSVSARVITDSTTLFKVSAAVISDPSSDTQALLDEWNKACATPGSATVTIPAGKVVTLNPVTFNGPCNSTNIHFQVLGNIEAPNDVSAWKGLDPDHWIIFHSVDGLTIDGSGQINGNGPIWYECRKSKTCSTAPIALSIMNSNNVNVNGLKMVNSPGKHIAVDACSGVHMSQLTITAPGDSPNTDGIHLQSAQHVQILSSTIEAGDDCISIGTGCSDVNISHINCGPGHGISVGSLGESDSQATVEQIHVSSCNFSNTMNGARVKTWQGGSGFARNIIFEQLTFNGVDKAIVIDQYYCNGDHNCPNKTSAVQVSDVHFVGIQGSTTNDVPINLACSQTIPCTGIVLNNVQLTAAKPITSYCLNAKGTAVQPVKPDVACLSKA